MLDLALADFEDLLKELSIRSSTVERLRAAVLYALFPAGKRVRPRFVFAVAEDFCPGSAARLMLEPACAIELLHAASLIHDDLPCMDNDDFRRGRPSCHRAFDEPTALLAADFMISQAFRIVTECGGMAAPQKLAIVAELSRAFSDLCGGQQLDVCSDCGEFDYRKTITLKTAALFRAAAKIGALSAVVEPLHQAILSNLGTQAGVVFQLVDDYLDRFGSIENRGRPESSDIRNEKHTVFAVSKEAGLFELRGEYETLLATLRSLESNTARQFLHLRALLESLVARVGELSAIVIESSHSKIALSAG